MLADARAQVIDAQVDGAELGKAVKALQRQLVHVARADGGHHRQPAHRIQTGADDTPVDAVETEMADQLRAHVDACGHLRGREAGDLQAEYLVEDDALLEDGLQAGDEFGLEFVDRGE